MKRIIIELMGYLLFESEQSKLFWAEAGCLLNRTCNWPQDAVWHIPNSKAYRLYDQEQKKIIKNGLYILQMNCDTARIWVGNLKLRTRRNFSLEWTYNIIEMKEYGSANIYQGSARQMTDCNKVSLLLDCNQTQINPSAKKDEERAEMWKAYFYLQTRRVSNKL